MSNPVFPVTLVDQQDSKYYQVELEDVSMQTPLEGGYVASRPKHTRAPRRTYTTGFTAFNNMQILILTQFWDSVKGGSVIFDWTDPVTLSVLAVRFVGGSMTIRYSGMGPTRLWDVQFKVQQA